MTPKYVGTDADNTWTVVQAMSFSLDGLGGVDTIHFGTSLRSSYTIVANPDGSVSIDTLSGASAALHATLYNVELLTFNDEQDVLDLRTYFGDTAAPLLVESSVGKDGAGVAVDASLQFTFSEAIKLGSGEIVLKSGTGELIETFGVNSPGISISGKTLTINPAGNLANGSRYEVHLRAGAVTDLAGNAFKDVPAMAFTTQPPAVLHGSSGNDSLRAVVGSMEIDGGAGTDTVLYAKPFSGTGGMSLTRSGNRVSVNDLDGIDILTDVERIAFSDKTFAVDIAGIGGQAYRLYQAAFNRTPDEAGLGFWIAQMDMGLSLQQAAQGFVNAPEFRDLVGANPSNRALVDKFYQNVLHRTPDEAGYAYWLGILDSGAATPAQLLVAFSESPENQAALAPVIGNGFAFIPFGG